MSQLHIHDATKSDLRDFLNEYRILLKIKAKRITNHHGKLQVEKVCRYCGRKYPDVKFKSKAHVFPKVFSKECDLISDSECDSCNNKHSLYETDLSRFLAVSRALRGETSRSNKPLKHNTDTILIEKGTVINDENNDEDVVTIIDKAGQVISLNPQNNEIVFNCSEEPYRPINIFKLFLKIALGILPFDEAIRYHYLIAFLNADKDDILGEFAKVCITYSEQYVSVPHAVVFRRKQVDAKRLLDVVQLAFKNIIVSFPLPFHSYDIKKQLYKETIDIIVSPPLFQKELHNNFWFDCELKDFSSKELQTEDLKFKMKFNYKAYEESMKLKYPELDAINFDELRIGALTFKPYK